MVQVIDVAPVFTRPSIDQWISGSMIEIHIGINARDKEGDRKIYLFEHLPNSWNMSLRVQKRFWGSKKIWMPTPAVHSV